MYTSYTFCISSEPAEATDHDSPPADATNPADLQKLASKQLLAPLQCQQASVEGECIPYAHPDHTEVQQHSGVLSAQQHIGAWTEPIAAAVQLGLAQSPEPRPLPAGWGGTPGSPAEGGKRWQLSRPCNKRLQMCRGSSTQ